MIKADSRLFSRAPLGIVDPCSDFGNALRTAAVRAFNTLGTLASACCVAPARAARIAAFALLALALPSANASSCESDYEAALATLADEPLDQGSRQKIESKARNAWRMSERGDSAAAVHQLDVALQQLESEPTKSAPETVRSRVRQALSAFRSCLTGATGNQVPQITSTPTTAAEIGQAYAYQVVAVDPEGDTLTYNLTVSPAGMTISDHGLVEWVPLSSGTFDVGISVDDGRGGRAVQLYSLEVSGRHVSASIGPAGGTLALPDGAELSVPPGALEAEVSIAIRQIPLPEGTILPPTGVLAGKVYSFEPDGLSFALPVELTIPYDPSLIPADYDERDILIHKRSEAPEFFIVGDATQEEIESPGQSQDPLAKTITVHVRGFSAYGAVGGNPAPTWVPTREILPAASVVVRRPPSGMRTDKSVNQNDCNAGSVPLPTRAGSDVQGLVIHSTNGGNPKGTLNGALGWASHKCVRDFAQYMIDKNGDIYQVAADDRITNHVGGRFSPSITPRTDLTNSNTIGIELLNNVGEPYDGRQIASLIRLLDFLSEKFALPRPERDPATGLYVRNRVNIGAGGERVITHFDWNGKCDPIGSMRSSGVYYPVDLKQGCATPAVTISQGDANAPALIDAIYDALAMLQRDRQHTGVLQASGGDALGLASPGNGGSVILREDPAAVEAVLGSKELQDHVENAPLIVGPGSTRALAGQHQFTDAIIAGRLEVNGDLDLRLTGTFYLAPNGRIVLRRNADGGNLTVTTRGIPIIQGLIDTIGDDAPTNGANGGRGGAVNIIAAGSAPWLVPTVIARGGDADFASDLIGTGGAGGAVTIEIQDGPMILGGGVGVQTAAADISTAQPPIRDQVDRTDLPPPPDYIGDRLPPPPPFNKYGSIAADSPQAGKKVPLRTAGFQIGFSRGILTTGGTGGIGLANASTNTGGGAGGAGGAITLAAGNAGSIQFKSVDLITGADVETALKPLLLPEGGTNRYVYFPASGSLGGTGNWQSGNRIGGSGGQGGGAGDITVMGPLVPAAASFVPVGPFGAGEIIGIDRPLNSTRPQTSDDPLFDFIFGRRIEARDASGNALYRLRLDLTDDAALGGSGGLPAGGISGEFPGWFGPRGANGTITGLPMQ
jgi:hypothetical protein